MSTSRIFPRLLFALLPVVLLPLRALGTGLPYLDGPTYIPCPGHPTAAAVGDFNADGRPDVVATASLSGSILLLLGTGGGALSYPFVYVVGGEPVDLRVVDLNHDQHPDVVWVDRDSGGIGWMLGTPSLPQPFSAVETQPGADTAVSLTLVDLDGDGWLDVVTANQGADVISVYRNAQGMLQVARTIDVGDAPTVVRAARWPGATSPTLLVAQPGALSDDVGVYGGADLHLQQLLPIHDGRALLVEDWDGDPWPDLVALESKSGSVSIYHGMPDGTLEFSFRFSVSPGATGLAMLPARDGLRHVLIAEPDRNRLSLYRGPSAGPVEPVDAYFVGLGVATPAVADLDGDGNEELIVPATEDDAVAVMTRAAGGLAGYRSSNSGSLPTAMDLLPPAPGRPTRLAVLCSGTGSLVIHQRNGLRWDEMLTIPAPAQASRVHWASLNSDSLPDLLLLLPGDHLELYLATAGGFAAPWIIPVGSGVRDAAAGDFDGDGNGDLVLADQTQGSLLVWQGDGQGSFVQTDAIPLQGAPEVCAVADLDNDGRDDLIALDDVRSAYLVFSNPTGTSNPLRFDSGNEPRALAIGHLNDDPYPDIVCGNSGDGTFTTVVSTAARFYKIGARMVSSPVGAGSVALADIDGNGLDDVLVASASAHDIALHLNSADGLFVVPSRFHCTSLGLGIACGDFDGDQKSDVVVLDSLGDALVTLLNQPDQTVPVAQFSLAARRTLAGVELSAEGPNASRARRTSDGMQIVLVASGPVDGNSPGALWRGLDASPPPGAVEYELLGAEGQVVARASAPAAEPAELRMLAPAPNPASSDVSLRFFSAVGPPQVDVVDLRGRRIVALVPTQQGGGWYLARWNGRDQQGAPVATGRYLAVVHAGSRRATAAITWSSR